MEAIKRYPVSTTDCKWRAGLQSEENMRRTLLRDFHFTTERATGRFATVIRENFELVGLDEPAEPRTPESVPATNKNVDLIMKWIEASREPLTYREGEHGE